MELQGQADFTPPEPIATYLDGRKKSIVNVRFGNLAGGPIKVSTAGKGKYHVRRQSVPLAHPLFARAAEAVPGLTPSLVLNVENNKLTGYVGLAAGEKVENLAAHLRAAPELFGLVGFDITALPSVSSSIEGGSLHLSVKNLRIRLGSAFDGTANFEVTDGSVSFDGNAVINVKGLVQGTLTLKRAPDGLVTGKVTLSVSLPKNFSGGVDVAWDGTSVTGEGKVAYQGEKLSGSVTLRMMERGQAEQLEKARQAPEGAPAPAAAPAGKGKPGRVDYVVFGEGDLAFAFTDWLNGTAHVIVDPKGFVTIIGKIMPQKEFTLFDMKPYVKHLIKLEVRATYGVPLLADIFIFASVALDAFAYLGPAKLYNIVAEGTYSTDPAQANDFSIRGSLNISAEAGLMLTASAGAGLEILGHDIKAGAGVTATAGVKGYAEATPIIGYRENAAPGQDKKGEFFIRGELEVAAQAFLGLMGQLFVALETPWWSPLSDKMWTWPLFSKEWPIGGTLGIGASVDYVFGSKQWPKFDFKPVDFDSDKFMTGLYKDEAQSGPGKKVEQKGKWQEKNSAAAQPPPKVSPKGNAAPGKPPTLPAPKPKPVPGGKKGGKEVDPNARTKGGKPVKQLQDEASKKGKKPGAAVPDIDLPVTLGDEPHTIRAHLDSERVVILMASGKFEEMRQKLDALSKTYAASYREFGFDKIAADIEKQIDAVKKVVDRGEREMTKQLKGVTDGFKRATIFDKGAHKTTVELKQALQKLGKQLTAGKRGKVIFGKAAKLKPGDPVVALDPEREVVVREVKRFEEYGGQYELLFRAESADGAFKTQLLYRDEGIKWRLTDKPHHEPFKKRSPVGGRVVIDEAHLNTGTRGDYDPPFYKQTIGGITYSRRGHLVAVVLGGPHNRDNIVALTKEANYEMEHTIEVPLSKKIKLEHSVYEYIVIANYPGGNTTLPVAQVQVDATRIYPNKMPKKEGYPPIKNV
jgi:hypothetical protein